MNPFTARAADDLRATAVLLSVDGTGCGANVAAPPPVPWPTQLCRRADSCAS